MASKGCGLKGAWSRGAAGSVVPLGHAMQVKHLEQSGKDSVILG